MSSHAGLKDCNLHVSATDEHHCQDVRAILEEVRASAACSETARTWVLTGGAAAQEPICSVASGCFNASAAEPECEPDHFGSSAPKMLSTSCRPCCITCPAPDPAQSASDKGYGRKEASIDWPDVKCFDNMSIDSHHRYVVERKLATSSTPSFPNKVGQTEKLVHAAAVHWSICAEDSDDADADFGLSEAQIQHVTSGKSVGGPAGDENGCGQQGGHSGDTPEDVMDASAAIQPDRSLTNSASTLPTLVVPNLQSSRSVDIPVTPRAAATSVLPDDFVECMDPTPLRPTGPQCNRAPMCKPKEIRPLPRPQMAFVESLSAGRRRNVQGTSGTWISQMVGQLHTDIALVSQCNCSCQDGSVEIVYGASQAEELIRL